MKNRQRSNSTPKGRWLRIPKVICSPELVSRQGRRPSMKQERAFIGWVNEQRAIEKDQTDILRIIAYWEPHIKRYLKRKGFGTYSSGFAKVVGSNYRPPSPELAAAMAAILHRDPRNEHARYALRVAKNGRTEKKRLFAHEAFDVHPTAHAAWVALKWIEQIKTALGTGKIEHVGGCAFNLGRMLAQANALHAMERLASKASPRGRRAAGYEATRQAWASFRKQSQQGQSLTAEWLLSTMHTNHSANWDSSKDRVRFKGTGRRRWGPWITVASFRNNLTAWKGSFTVSPMK